MAQKSIYGPWQEIDLSPGNNTVVISFIRNPMPDTVDQMRLDQLPIEEILRLLYDYPPLYVHRDGTNNYVLIAHHWAYKAQCRDKKLPNRCLVISESSLSAHLFLKHGITANANDIDKWIKAITAHQQKMDVLDNNYINAVISLYLDPKDKCASTIARYIGRLAKQTCPECGEAILGPQYGWPIDAKAAIKEYRASCANSSQPERVSKFATDKDLREPKYRCSFCAMLNSFERCRLDNYDFPSSIWIVEEIGQRCPRCRGKLYLRTIHTGWHTTKKIIVCQFNGFSYLDKKCDFKEDYSLWQPRLI